MELKECKLLANVFFFFFLMTLAKNIFLAKKNKMAEQKSMVSDEEI